MKKIFALLLVLVMVLAAAHAEPEDPLDRISGMSFEFCSGVGAWSTIMILGDQGVFTGDYHDSEMGESADAYPDGTVYGCTFSGRLSLAGQADEYSWRLKVDTLTVDPEEETIEDGIRFVPSDSYGIAEGDELVLYRPGTPVSMLSEEMQFWAHIMDQENPSDELEDWFLMNATQGTGFVGYDMSGFGNPWTDVTAEQLEALTGLTFGVPDGAEDVFYRYLESENLAEMLFAWETDEFCARIQPAELEEGQMPDISGMYFDWENEEEIRVGDCPGTLGLAQAGSTDWVELCQWYDAGRGLQYALAVYTTDPDGLDLVAFAEQVYGR